MFTALLLVCMVGSTDCIVNTSNQFYFTLTECVERSQKIMEEANKNEELSYVIEQYHCVGWGEPI